MKRLEPSKITPKTGGAKNIARGANLVLKLASQHILNSKV